MQAMVTTGCVYVCMCERVSVCECMCVCEYARMQAIVTTG